MSNEVLKFDWTKFDAERALKGVKGAASMKHWGHTAIPGSKTKKAGVLKRGDLITVAPSGKGYTETHLVESARVVPHGVHIKSRSINDGLRHEQTLKAGNDVDMIPKEQITSTYKGFSEPYILDRWGHKIACAEDPPHGEGVVLTFDWAKFDAERGHGFVSGRDQKALKRSVAAAPKSPRPRDENNLAARPHAEIHHGNTSKGIIGRLFGSKGTPVTVHDPD